jgi:hypothetical protein
MASEIETLKAWLTDANFSAVTRAAGSNKRVLSYLTALSYDPDVLLSWRAVEAMGMAASRIAESDPEYIRIHLRRLNWLLNDESGGIGWRAPELIGEILFRKPGLFADFIPLLVNLMDMEPEDRVRFKSGWLWALGRLAKVDVHSCREALPWILTFLTDPDPQVRGMAVWCLGQLHHPVPPDRKRHLQSDFGEVALYISPHIKHLKVRDIFRTFFADD